MLLLCSLGIAIATALPWIFSARLIPAGVAFVVSFVLAVVFVYLGTPYTASPLFGGVGVLTAFFVIVSCIVAVSTSEDAKEGWIPALFGCGVLALFVFTTISNSTMFNARSYASLVPPIESRKWDADFQPKDPRHFRVSSEENARFLASRAIGQATVAGQNGQPYSIGSQFSVQDNQASVQIIRNELWTIVPLDWRGWGPQQSNTPGVPGYIKVSAENPNLPAEYVALPHGKEFRYTPEAYWGLNLERLVWSSHPDKYIADIHLEIDDEDNPHYVVSLAEPTIGWWGEKVIGALIIDPSTGAGVEALLPLDKVPHWVDRVESRELVHRNIDLHGRYSQGFFNKALYGNNVLTATATHFGYGSDGEPVFATGITSGNSGSLVAVYYTNTRTGKTVEYQLSGGATEERAVEQCNLIGTVRNQQYHGTTPQLYNVYGRLSYVVPIQNATHAFAGVCIVDVMNVQVIAWGQNAHDAELAFKQVIVANGSQMAIDGTRKLLEMSGRVSRVSSITSNGSTAFFFLIENMDHLFTVPVTASNKVPMTREGDQVWVEYYDSQEEVIPASKFDNRSIVLKASPLEAEVNERAQGHQAAVHERIENGRDVQKALDKLTPEERALVERSMKK